MRRIAILAMVIALMAPSVAFADDSSSCQAYNPQTCESVTTTTGETDGSLPFTGLDVGLLVVGGGTLLGAGLVARRLSRRQT